MFCLVLQLHNIPSLFETAGIGNASFKTRISEYASVKSCKNVQVRKRKCSKSFKDPLKLIVSGVSYHTPKMFLRKQEKITWWKYESLVNFLERGDDSVWGVIIPLFTETWDISLGGKIFFDYPLEGVMKYQRRELITSIWGSFALCLAVIKSP